MTTQQWLSDAAEALGRVTPEGAPLPMTGAPRLLCKQCGGLAEEVRRCYATPVCFACLPPPKPLPVARFRFLRLVKPEETK